MRAKWALYHCGPWPRPTSVALQEPRPNAPYLSLQLPQKHPHSPAPGFPCFPPQGPKRLPQLQALAAGSQEPGPWVHVGACRPQRPRVTPWNPQRHPAHRLWQTAATPGSPPCLKATRPQDSVPDTGPWWAPTNPGHLTSVSTGSSGPRRVPRPRAAPKSPSSVAAANRGLQLRTPAASDGFPSTRFPREGSPWTEAQLTWASASSCGPRWVSGHQLASFCPGSQTAGERRPAGSRSGGYSCGRTQVASQQRPMKLLSVRLSQPAEAWSHYRTSGFLRLLCGTVDSEARHKPLFPGAWLTPLDPESRAQAHQKRLQYQALPPWTQTPGLYVWTVAPGQAPGTKTQTSPPAYPGTRPTCPRSPSAMHTSRISGGLTGDGVCLLKPVCEDWRRCLHPQTCRRQRKSTKILIPRKWRFH